MIQQLLAVWSLVPLPFLNPHWSCELNSPIPVHLVCWFLKCRCSLLPSPVWPLLVCLDSRFLCNIALWSIRLYFHHQSHPHLGIVFALDPSLHSFWSYSPPISSSILDTNWPEEFIYQCPIFFFFSFSYCSWGSQGKNTEVVCHSLLQWIMFCQNSPPWPVCLGWPSKAWFIVSLN